MAEPTAPPAPTGPPAAPPPGEPQNPFATVPSTSTDVPLANWLRAGRFWRTQMHLGHLAIPVSLPLVVGTLVWRFVLGPLGLLGELDPLESVVGLMARQAWIGGLPEPFVWGHPTMAALEPLGAAATFTLWGEGALALRLVPFLVGGATLLFSLALVSHWVGSRASVAAAFLGLVAFPGTSVLLARSWGGVAPGVFWGVLALGAACLVTLNQARHYTVPTGIMCGLALWGHPAMMPFAATATGMVLLTVSRVLWSPGFILVAGGHLIRFGVGLGLGLAPVMAWGGGLRALFRLETGVPIWESVPSVETLGGFFEEMTGGRWAPLLLVALVGVALPGLVARGLRRGIGDPGVRLVAGALSVALLSLLQAMAASPVSADEAGLRLVPFVAVLPFLVAATTELPKVELAGVLVVAALFLAVDPARLPAARAPGADVPVDAIIAHLDQHPAQRCYAPAVVAYRVAFVSGERHRCVSVHGRDYVRAWRVELAAGPRAYFFAAEEISRARQLDNDLRSLRLPRKATAAGPFLVRITSGAPYPPTVPPVETEHGRRDRRALIDGDLQTHVVARADQPVTLDLVWPTSLTSVSYWQDITRLDRAPCRVRASIRLADGRVLPGGVQPLSRTCHAARRWSLWALPSMEVRLPLPPQEAQAVIVDTPDDGALWAATEMRVTPRSQRGLPADAADPAP